MSFDDFEDFFGGGSKGPASLNPGSVGESAGGVLFKMERLEERDDAGNTKMNEWGRPKPLLVTWVITDLRDPANPEDDGARRIWWKGNALYELKNFLRENGFKAPQMGGYIAMKVVGTKPSGKPKPMKLHQAFYRPGTPEQEGLAYQYAAKWDRQPAKEDDFFGGSGPASTPAAAQAQATTLDSMRRTANFTDEAPF